jgi:hypothetical protein
MYTHIFGPVPSRRLGTSLGVDLTPTKTCSLTASIANFPELPLTQITETNFAKPMMSGGTEICIARSGATGLDYFIGNG